MTGNRELFLNQVVHEARAEVDEKGTVAAAATYIEVPKSDVGLVPSGPIRFRADHPFWFLIRHEGTGAILFMGRLADPTQ